MANAETVTRGRTTDRARLRSLLEKYGTLLTDRQAAMANAYAIEGLSFSDVARQHGVSRQAVHEAVRGAERILSEYEAKLSHLTPPEHNLVRVGELTEVFSKLESLKLRIARTGIIYSVDWIRREIDSVMTLLADQSGENKTQNVRPSNDPDQTIPIQSNA